MKHDLSNSKTMQCRKLLISLFKFNIHVTSNFRNILIHLIYKWGERYLTRSLASKLIFFPFHRNKSFFDLLSIFLPAFFRLLIIRTNDYSLSIFHENYIRMLSKYFIHTEIFLKNFREFFIDEEKKAYQ